MAEVIGGGPSPAPPPPPPPPDQPNMDQVVQMVNAENPEVWYQQAAWFDKVKQTLSDLNDGFRREAKGLEELWHGDSAGAYGGQVGRVASLIDQIRQGPDYAAALRRAGDALASAQQRVRDLQAQKGQNPDGDQSLFDQQARQILIDLATAYGDSGALLGQGLALDGVTGNGQVAPPPFPGAGQQTGGGQGPGLGVRAGGPGQAADPGTGAGPFAIGGGGSGTGAPVAVLGRSSGMRRNGMFGFGGEDGSDSGTRWGEPQLTDSGVITGSSGGFGSGRASTLSGKDSAKSRETVSRGSGTSTEDELQDLLGSRKSAAPATALGKPAKRSRSACSAEGETETSEQTDPLKPATTGGSTASGKLATLKSLARTGPTGSTVQTDGSQTADPSTQTAQTQSVPQIKHAVATAPQTTTTGPQPATAGSQTATTAAHPATAAAQPATAAQPAAPAAAAHSGQPAATAPQQPAKTVPQPANTGPDKVVTKAVTATGGGASAHDLPGVPVTPDIPAPVPKGPNPAAEMHLTIPAQATAPLGPSLHGGGPPLPVRTVSALSASGTDAATPAEGTAHGGHGGSPGTSTGPGGGTPMMPMGTGGMMPRPGHHASSVHLSADPDSWVAAADTPLAVLGRPVRLPEPPPELPPVDGTELKPEGDKNG
ncbi:hypothetical protein [Amycolatopsis pigmentata]|uniref:Proteins of 100 residues with WXG n=1 Tax=Amycolatopsis pigmentata TaxID=450801 RepID=A0ABW5G714_9PSEU